MSLRCYRRFNPPRAIGFDLDDTLYDNTPVLRQADLALGKFLAKHYPDAGQWSVEQWNELRLYCVSQDPGLAHDISDARHVSLEYGLRNAGYSHDDARQGARDAMEVFLQWRSRANIPPSTHALLEQLSKKCALFVISNGNANITDLGIEHHFQFALHAARHQPMKPAADLFSQAQQRLALPAREILYVGDHPVADVIGANRAGWHSAWLNTSQKQLQHRKKPLQLPTLEISSLEDLCQLL